MLATRHLLWLLSSWTLLYTAADHAGISGLGQASSSLLRVTNVPDFVGFSYSRADMRGGPPRSRFISFLNEVRTIEAWPGYNITTFLYIL
jgi:hypothetical protein